MVEPSGAEISLVLILFWGSKEVECFKVALPGGKSPLWLQLAEDSCGETVSRRAVKPGISVRGALRKSVTRLQ